ncbi:hypothetical protein KC973_04005 [Candidatus Saccharibacteria bacterium]|nr:hypothetical protein [Candidatus Saccharibacteria bacterium]
MSEQTRLLPDFSEAQAREMQLPLNPISRARRVNAVVRELGLVTYGSPFPLFPRFELVALGKAADKARRVREVLQTIDQGEED